MKNNNVNKELVLAQLRKTPVVQVACDKVGLSRMSFYRWKKDDEEFSKKVDEALRSGQLLVNDLAETQLITAVQGRDIRAIIYWLKNHHPDYRSKLELSGEIKHIREELTTEETEMLREALSLAGFSEKDLKDISDKHIIPNEQKL